MKFLFRTALAVGVISVALALASVSWLEYSAHNSCASVGESVPPARTAGASVTVVDEILPEYQIGERHSVFVDAPTAQVFDSLKHSKANDQPIIKLFDLLPVLAGKRDASSHSEAEPLYETLRDSSGLVLEKTNRELVTANIATVDEHTPSTPDTLGGFVAYRLGHNEMKLPVSFSVDPAEGGTHLTTETHIMFDDRDLCHSFAWYWGVIYPGSSLLRVDFLEAVKRRAETARSGYRETERMVPKPQPLED